MANERDAGRYAVMVTAEAEPFRSDLRVYVYSREDRLVTTATLRLTRKELKMLLKSQEAAEDQQGQPTLPPWNTEGEDNVKWLPPQP